MEITKLPYIQRMVLTPANHKALYGLMLRLSDRDTHKAAAIVQLLITTLNSVTQRIAAYTSDTPEEEATNAIKFKAVLPAILDRLTMELGASRNLLPHVILRVKYGRSLGNMRALSRLREIMQVAERREDSEECIEWMQSNFDIQRCDDCGKWEYAAKIARTYHDQDICRSCIDNNYTFSEHYQQFVHNENGRWALMPDQREVYIDEDDDSFHYSDDADRYVHEDWEPPEQPVIRSYHSSKGSTYLQHDSWTALKHRWFGVELEVEIKNNQVGREDKARLLNDILNDGTVGKKVFFENDGSLSNGFEIITQPMSLPAQRELWSWLRDRDAVRHLLSHNTSTCGLHVHVNKDGLSQIQIAKIVTFINDERNADLVRSIARRYAEGYCKIKKKDLDTAHLSTDRYEAVNITPRNTIEFRIFKGSLKYESVISAIEFCNALVEFSAQPEESTAESLNADRFIDFINNRHLEETQTLRPYLNAVLQTA